METEGEKKNYQSAWVKKLPASPPPQVLLHQLQSDLLPSASLIQILCGGAVAAEDDIISAAKVRSATPPVSLSENGISSRGGDSPKEISFMNKIRTRTLYVNGPKCSSGKRILAPSFGESVQCGAARGMPG